MSVDLKFENKKFSVNIVWLRDSCRCPKCYNSLYSSRITTIDNFLTTTKIKILSYKEDKNTVIVEWSDGHNSTYDIKWIYDIWTPNNQSNILPHYCFGKELGSLPPKISVDRVNQTEGQHELVESILKYGVGIIINVQPTVEATEKVVRCLASPQSTLFGTAMWTVGNKEGHEDPAYLSGPLVVHTDSTYFSESTGLQIFHMLERDSNGTGGESTYVDGFKAAEILKQENPTHFKNLTEIEIESEYIEPGAHYKCTGPVIKVNKTTGEIYQIRFNIYDRSPKPPTRSQEFYESYAHFVEILKRKDLYWKQTLLSGTIIFVNNWRVFHGRTEFTGRRYFCGCYVSMSDFLSKARILGLKS
ncbi:trimethyllysine dioxygenase, mitochondrial-like [Daktulosphaira vitifoliae]|uniref:trimethyllysine dioxygenase, mitochondrial-like n=1 Tax=Daktulosphaira vitifoliae TaxID=58002 RepID=UPI0021A9F480|nr:trimethyllysine dioxygenase, mitochondrial-like [Daktulosphaira vitifoliae]XP_050544700.1 trimethyllysine dioxygenase, mitochondrial-like [Daktulosphaira vitifoliae]XP_050544701.1 trimethyllysine dioxygenase, mitochondrial-like [Daktulosphaira vitifoliae]